MQQLCRYTHSYIITTNTHTHKHRSTNACRKTVRTRDPVIPSLDQCRLTVNYCMMRRYLWNALALLLWSLALYTYITLAKRKLLAIDLTSGTSPFSWRSVWLRVSGADRIENQCVPWMCICVLCLRVVPMWQVNLKSGANVLYWRTTGIMVGAKVVKPVLLKNIQIEGKTTTARENTMKWNH